MTFRKKILHWELVSKEYKNKGNCNYSDKGIYWKKIWKRQEYKIGKGELKDKFIEMHEFRRSRATKENTCGRKQRYVGNTCWMKRRRIYFKMGQPILQINAYFPASTNGSSSFSSWSVLLEAWEPIHPFTVASCWEGSCAAASLCETLLDASKH